MMQLRAPYRIADRFSISFGLIWIIGGLFSTPTLRGEGTFATEILPLLQNRCFSCHGSESHEGNLSLERFTSSELAAREPELWWRVLKNVRAGVMPPASEPQLSANQKEALASWIKRDVFGIDPSHPPAGRQVLRRLNRTEYGNTISDLMGIRFDPSILFPPDDSGHGFDNVGEAMTFSPLLLEKYFRAAKMVVEQSVPTVTKMVPRIELTGRDFIDRPTTGGRNPFLDGKVHQKVHKRIPIDQPGTYALQLDVKLHGSFDFDPARYTVEFSIDQESRSKSEYGWDENKLLRTRWEETWSAGEHELAFELHPIPSSRKDEGYDRPPGDPTHVRFEIVSIAIEGPLNTPVRVHPPNYRRFFPRDEPPRTAEERREYAFEVLRPFATKAFRGPVSDETLERLVGIVEASIEHSSCSFEQGIAQAMMSILASPRFLFRIENRQDATVNQEPSESGSLVDEWTLASRLSYFLWSTMPDAELIALIEQGKLRDQLPVQLERMLKDPRSEQFVGNFVGQWLRTRDVTQVSIDPIVVLGFQREYEELREKFRSRFRRRGPPSEPSTPEDEKVRNRFRELRDIADRFNSDLKRAMRRETEMCFEAVVRGEASLLDLLDCNYTYLNERLARHYGIEGVQGDEMRRVPLPADSPRGGVLSHASMLVVTSNPTRTSPVKRGLFVLENLLGTPAPAAPAAVPNLEDSASKFGDREPTLRELLAAHRESPLCASCHARMDPLGLALENFNALGMWREVENGHSIDPAGTLMTGESFESLKELKKILREKRAEDFYRCVAQKLLTYAMGRGLEYTDEQTIDEIVARVQASGGQFQALLQGVVESAPFQKIQ